MNFNKLFKKWLLIIIIPAQTFLIHAEDKITFEHISILDGLSNSTVQNILQDSFGFMWFATSDGLNKYDGYEFTVYREDSEIPGSLVGNLVLELYEDSRGNLWIGTDKALNLYNRDNDSFESFLFDATNDQVFYNGVISIYEDHEGNLLIGKAYHGIQKFNREEKVYESFKVSSDSSAFENFAIFDIVEDSQNRIWYSHGRNFGIAEGIVRVSADRSEKTDMTDSLAEVNGNPEFSLFFYKDKNDRIYFNSFDGNSCYYDPEDNSIKKNRVLENANLFRMTIDDKGRQWFVTTNMGLIQYDPLTGKSRNFTSNNSEESSISSNALVSIYTDNSGIFWIGTSNDGINKFDPDKEPISTIRIPEKDNPDNFKPIVGFSKSEFYPGKTWVASMNSIHLFDIETGELDEVTVPLKPGMKFNIRSITESNSRYLWIGNWGDGVYKFDLVSNKVSKLGEKENNTNFLTSSSARQLLNDNDKYIWISTLYGLNRYDISTGKNQRFVSFDTTYTRKVFEKFADIKSGNLYSGISQVGNNQNLASEFKVKQKSPFLLASSGEAFLVGDQTLWDYGWIENSSGDTIWYPELKNLKHAGGDAKNFLVFEIVTLEPGDYVLHYVSDDSHSFDEWNANVPYDPNLWGIQLYSLNDNELEFFNNNLDEIDDNHSLVGSYIRSVYKDSEGNIWAGSEMDGFSIFDTSSNSFTQFGANRRTATSFTNNRINSIVEESGNKMLLATFGGLIEFDRNTEELKTYSTNSGLPTNYLMDILKDDNGNFWISSLKGLIKMSRTKEGQVSFIAYDLKDGIQSYNYIQGSSYKDAYGNLFFGGDKGFNAFKPGNINSMPPRIVINKMLISNKPVNAASANSPINKSITVTDSLKLSYNQNDFSFEFTALHYARPERNQYAYKLNGFDEEWNYDNRRYATYTNLDPGEYTFTIQAANSDGVWSENPKELFITILPPWWLTIYAYFGYALIIVIGFISFNKYQKNSIIKKERERQKIQEAELRAAAAEAQARAIQAENDRKTKELEEARNLQLSMLPDTIPNLPNLDIAVYMSTATEVGGDYYDFHIGLDGTLTVVIGDATGHGLNAGTMVTATKSLFNSHAANPDILFTFNEISRCLKDMRLRLLTMCLMILKIKGNELIMSAAGIPPALLFRDSNKNVEEIVMKGMPLGSPSNFTYELKSTRLNPGDTILLMSDGFPELFNDKNEMYGYDRIHEKFSEIGNLSPEDIIDELKDTCDTWRKGREQDDDITFVVIKVK